MRRSAEIKAGNVLDGVQQLGADDTGRAVGGQLQQVDAGGGRGQALLYGLIKRGSCHLGATEASVRATSQGLHSPMRPCSADTQ